MTTTTSVTLLPESMTVEDVIALGLEPLHDNCIVVPLTPDEKTAGGIIIPRSSQDNDRAVPREAKVVAIGPGRQLEDGKRGAMGVKPGDHVLYGSYAGADVTIRGHTFRCIREIDIISKVKPKPVTPPDSTTSSS